MYGNSARHCSPELAEVLKASVDEHCAVAAEIISKAHVLVLVTGAGFSADSGLAVYADVANVDAYSQRGLDYQDICQPYWIAKDPGLFYGFWGQRFNEYRSTQPHKGYEIIAKWRDVKNSGPVAEEMRECMDKFKKNDLLRDEGEATSRDPDLVQGKAGAFFTFTSNVDAHSFDYFQAHEIRECHGNVELWQCSRRHCSRSGRIWRAPMNHRFNVNIETMMAPPGPFSAVSSNNLSKEKVCDDETPDDTAHAGHTLGGKQRKHSLRYMLESDEHSNNSKCFEENWPKCRDCGDAARPAILMFGDLNWNDNDAQEEQWYNWKCALYKLADSRQEVLNVAILEIGCGLNVPTCRYESEGMVMSLQERNANVKLIRINPDYPLVDYDDLISSDNVISIMSRGLEALEKIDATLETLSE